jgi:outer membrane protein TolC
MGAALLAPAVAAAQPLTVEKALQEALDQSPRVRAARARSDGADASARSLRGRMLPLVDVSDEQQHWNDNFAIAFALPSQPGQPSAPPLSLVAREINANTFSVAAAQPLVGLLHLSQDYSALSDTAVSAEAEFHAAEAAVREEVQTQFLRLFEARALAEIAQASQKQLAEQIEVAQAKLKAGVLTTADVLRLRVAAANARQQEIQAGAEEQVARANLLEALGRQVDDTSVDFAEPVALESVAESPPELGAAVERALAQRPELESAQRQASAAQTRATARGFDLLPEVNLEAAYIHVHGQILAPIDSAFVGIKADWPIWEWGAKWYERKAAQAQAAAADAQADATRRRVGGEVAARVAQSRASRSAVEVAQTTIDSAEEAYRVTDALVKAGTATTTDLLDALSALTQARLNLTRAKYEYGIARVALTRAIGG